jgi:uncharacterized membrane protein YgdD (TMEM256/DUF423 family)
MNTLLVGAILVGTAVAAGAFGAHALRARLGERVSIWQTAVQYQMVHGLALVALGVLAQAAPGASAAVGLFGAAAWLFLVGTVLFSGSLYVLGPRPVRWLGPLTPLGGLCFLAGWALLVVAAVRLG